MSELTLTVMGPVGSGKTTYFAALWFLLKNAQDRYEINIDREKVVSDRVYLTNISDLWAKREKIPHTSTGNWHPMELPLRHRVTAQRLTLHIPDLAGETFESALASRAWNIGFEKNLIVSSALLLFVGYKEYRAAEFIDHTFVVRRAMEDAPPPREWVPTVKVVPSDVYYTDMLQQVAYYDPERKYRMSIILSAWDEIEIDQRNEIRELYLAPERWLALKFPLLDQFLKSHPERFQVKIFGVSAYGFDQEKDANRERLIDIEPYERVKVISDGKESHDITLPLSSLLLP